MMRRGDFDFIVVGAGLAGCVMAERIANMLNKKVLIIEQRNHIGGNCADHRNEFGILIHRYGPHLFHTDYDVVFNYLSNFTEWRVYEHKVLAFIDGKKIPIPFNFNSMDLIFPQGLAERLQKKLLIRFREGAKVPILNLMEIDDEDIRFLANFIYEKVFLNYTVKQWGKRPEEIANLVTARVPVVVGRDNRYFHDKYQAVPLEGYSKMFERMIANKNINLLLNTDFKSVLKVDVEQGKFFFLGNEFKGKVIFTAMLDYLFDYVFGALPYRSLRFESKDLNVEFFQEVAVVNYPNDFEYTRIAEYKHIHPVETPWTTIVYEYPVDFKPGKIPYYPVFTDGALDTYNKYLELAARLENLVIVGRLAEYRYYDMDDVVKRVLDVFEERLA